MRVLRVVIPALVGLAAACSHAPATTTLAPREGPRASIRALYDGGLLRRRVSAVFSVGEPAYVLVAHLGGDGVISVVYPKRAGNAWAAKNEVYRTASFAGDYDAAPEFYLLTSTRMRSLSARTYSYDGRGNGFVFMITSRTPFRINEISDYNTWDDIEVVDYQHMLDPRRAIKEYADMVTGGSRYSITYAQSFTAYAYTSYADQVWDCALLSSFVGPWSYGYGWGYGYGYGSSTWFLSALGGNGNGCGSSAYAYAYGFPGYYGWNLPRPVTSVGVTNPIPNTPVAQRTPRPTFYPSTPTERRTSERRTTTGTYGSTANAGRDVLSYRPTRSENPTFAPQPVERQMPPRRTSDWVGTRTATESRREVDRSGTTSRPSTSTSGSSGSASTGSSSSSSGGGQSTARQPQPTMSPSHSEPARRPPSE